MTAVTRDTGNNAEPGEGEVKAAAVDRAAPEDRHVGIVVRDRADDRLLPRSLAELRGDRRTLISALPVAVAAALLAQFVGPFKVGGVLSVSGHLDGNPLGGPLWWICAGLVGGVVVGSRGRVVRAGPARRALDADQESRTHLAIGAAAGLVLGAVLPISLTFGLTLVALLGLAPGWSRVWTTSARRIGSSRALLSGLIGAVPGLQLGGLLPMAFGILLAIVVVGAVVELSRRSAASGAAPLVTAAALVVALVASWGAIPHNAGAADSERVTVKADEEFTGTNVMVQAGQRLHITAEGTVSFVDGDKNAKADPDGYPARYGGCGGPGLCGGLLGRIAGGALFFVGSELVRDTTTAGELELAINDYDVSDNTGSFTVRISVGPANTPLVLTKPRGLGVLGSGPSTTWISLLTGLLAFAAAFVGVGLGRRTDTGDDPDIYLTGQPRWVPLDANTLDAAPATGGGVQLVPVERGLRLTNGEEEALVSRTARGLRLRAPGASKASAVAAGDHVLTIGEQDVLLRLDDGQASAFVLDGRSPDMRIGQPI